MKIYQWRKQHYLIYRHGIEITSYSSHSSQHTMANLGNFIVLLYITIYLLQRLHTVITIIPLIDTLPHVSRMLSSKYRTFDIHELTHTIYLLPGCISPLSDVEELDDDNTNYKIAHNNVPYYCPGYHLNQMTGHLYIPHPF